MSFKDLIDSCEAASPYHMPPRAETRDIEAKVASDRVAELAMGRPVPRALFFAIKRGGRSQLHARSPGGASGMKLGKCIYCGHVMKPLGVMPVPGGNDLVALECSGCGSSSLITKGLMKSGKAG